MSAAAHPQVGGISRGRRSVSALQDGGAYQKDVPLPSEECFPACFPEMRQADRAEDYPNGFIYGPESNQWSLLASQQGAGQMSGWGMEKYQDSKVRKAKIKQLYWLG